MIPIRDENRKKTFPLITLLLLAANVTAFVFQMIDENGMQAVITKYGAIPWEIVHFQELPHQQWVYQTDIPNILTLITSMFMHGGVLHLLGNMLYLWIFADNVEALTGHVRFLPFYILCGIAAAITHIIFDPQSTVPMVGASGAISGVLGAYFIRFPKAKVDMLFIFFFFIRVFRVPAPVMLGVWFLMQLLSGFGSLGQQGGGVAWFAHIGGFAAGMILIFLFERKGRTRVNLR